nr:uncharacterized protein LOC114825465 [Malus domestica]
MGYVSSQKGYKVYNPNTGKLEVSRNVRFDEYSPYFHKGLETNANPAHISPDNSQLTESITDAVPSYSEPSEAQPNQQAISAPRRNPTRDRHPPVRLQEYVIYTARHPISAAISYHIFLSSHTSFLNKVSHTFEPRNFHEATSMPEWQDAMTKELQALNDNQTWSVVELLNGKKVMGSDNISEIKTVKQSLHQKFSIKDLGPLKYFLGIELVTSSKALFLNKRKYVLDLLDKDNMMECKPARTPLASKLQWHEKGEPLSDPRVYQRMVGKLVYLTIIRPDISYSVSLASQFMHSRTLVHWEIVKRILRYLKGSVGMGIIMKNNGSNHILAYTDVDWAGNAFD